MERRLDFVFGASVFALTALAAVFYGLRGRFEPLASGKPSGARGAALGDSITEFGDWTLGQVGRVLAKREISPDVLSWLGLVLSIASGVAVAAGYFGVSALLMMGSGACDAVDGKVARLSGAATPGGAVLDSSLDRYADFALLFGTAVHYRDNALFLAAVLLAIHGSYMVSYSTAKAEAAGCAVPTGAMKRADRWIWLMAGMALSAVIWSAVESPAREVGVPLLTAVAVVGVLANVSAVRRLAAVWSSASGSAKV